jgi:hypothetical protein
MFFSVRQENGLVRQGKRKLPAFLLDGLAFSSAELRLRVVAKSRWVIIQQACINQSRDFHPPFFLDQLWKGTYIGWSGKKILIPD